MRFLQYGATLVLGLVIGFATGYFGRLLFTIELKKELGLGDLLNFAAVVIFAFLLQNYLQKHFSDSRVEKDHLIGIIGQAQDTISQIRKDFFDAFSKKKLSAEYKAAVVIHFRNLSNSLDLLRAALGQCGYEAEADKCAELQSLYVEYKRQITGGSFPTGPYGSDVLSDAEKTANKLYLELTNKRIRVNKT